MKIIEKIRTPLLIATIAGGLYIIDSLLSNLFVDNGSFMWVAFVSWTIFFNSKLKDRVNAFIGVLVGILAAITTMAITNLFNVNVYTISLSGLLGVFLVNFGVMLLDNPTKLRVNISGAFVGMFLTFSGLGVGLNPMTSFKEAGLIIAIIVVYIILGLICGFLSTQFSNKK